MGIFGKMFGKKPESSGGRGQISMHAISLQQGGAVNARRCGDCGRTFPCPANTQTIITSNPGGFVLDVGGYCDRCGAYRCQEHARWMEMAEMTYGIACTSCGERLRGAS